MLIIKGVYSYGLIQIVQYGRDTLIENELMLLPLFFCHLHRWTLGIVNWLSSVCCKPYKSYTWKCLGYGTRFYHLLTWNIISLPV
jgi:hypothetical protein